MDNGPVRQRRRRDAEKVSKADMSRERVLISAARIFSVQGYAGTTMRDVAKEAGLQAGSLYDYYPSKDLLIEAVLDMGIHGVSNAVYSTIAELPPSTSYADRIRAAVFAHLRSVLQFGDYALASRRVLGQVPPDVRASMFCDATTWRVLGQAAWRPRAAARRNPRRCRRELARTFIWVRSTRPRMVPAKRDDHRRGASQFNVLIADGLFRPPPEPDTPSASRPEALFRPMKAEDVAHPA